MKFTDQLGNQIELNSVPKKIISTVPSQTELLAYLGLDDSIIGITKFCIHPDNWFRSKKRVGGTKNLNLELITELKPDLIIANKEENDKSQITFLQEHFPVWISDIKTLEDAYHMIISLSELLDCKDKALLLVNQLKDAFDSFKNNSNSLKPRVAYLIWSEPIMVAAHDTFINEMLKCAGFENVFSNKNRYPESSESEIAELNPDFIFLSSEPYPFKEKHIQHFKNSCPDAQTILVDGELFSWYGSRLLKSADYFNKLRKDLIK